MCGPSDCAEHLAITSLQLTQVLFFVLCLFKDPSKKQLNVVNNDEGRGKRRPAVVFHNQVVTLKFPEDVCISLNNLKGVT